MQCYVLEIVESFLVNDLSVLDAETEEAKLRKTWVPRFVAQGGLTHLLKLFETALTMA